MGEPPHLCSLVQGHDGVGTQGAKTHGGDIEQAQVIGLGAVFVAHANAEIVALNLRRCHGVGQPFIAFGHHIELCAKRSFVRLSFGTGVHQRALGAGKGLGLVLAFNEILPNFRADEFQQKTHMPEDGVVAQDGMVGLQQVVHTDRAEQRKQEQPPRQLTTGNQHQQTQTQTA